MVEIRDDSQYVISGKELKELGKTIAVNTIHELNRLQHPCLDKEKLPPKISLNDAIKLLKGQGLSYSRTTILRWKENTPSLFVENGMGARIFLYTDKLIEYVESGRIKKDSE